MEAPPVQYVRTTDGYDLALSIIGSGQDLLLVPSRLSHQEHDWVRFGAWQKPLAERFRLVRYDARGQGLSTRGLKSSVAASDYVRDLAFVVESLALRRPILLSHGFGAHVAVRFILEHPQSVRALILVAAAIDMKEWTMSLWDNVADENWEFFARTLAPRDLPADELGAYVAQIGASETREDFLLASRMIAASDIRRLLPGVATPTLVIDARNFAMLPPDTGSKVAAAIPHARLRLIGGSDLQFLGDPTEFVNAIESFVTTLDRDETRPSGIHELAPVRLSAREAEVLGFIAQGLSNQQIADELVISVRTVERHINHIYAKIGAHNKAQATAYALQHHVVTSAGS